MTMMKVAATTATPASRNPLRRALRALPCRELLRYSLRLRPQIHSHLRIHQFQALGLRPKTLCHCVDPCAEHRGTCRDSGPSILRRNVRHFPSVKIFFRTSISSNEQIVVAAVPVDGRNLIAVLDPTITAAFGVGDHDFFDDFFLFEGS